MKTSTKLTLLALLAMALPIPAIFATMRFSVGMEQLAARIDDVQNGRDRHLQEWPTEFDTTEIRRDTHDTNLVLSCKDGDYRLCGVTRNGVAGDGGWRDEGITTAVPSCSAEITCSGQFRVARRGEDGLVYIGTGPTCLMRTWGGSLSPAGERFTIQTQALKEQGRLFKVVKGSLATVIADKDTAAFVTMTMLISRDRHLVSYLVNDRLVGKLLFKEPYPLDSTVTIALQTSQVNRYQEIYFRNLKVLCKG